MKKIAVIGCGHWGRNLVRNFHKLGALHTVCESSPDREGEIRKEYRDVAFTKSYEEVLNNKEISAVAVATPAETHFEMAVEALKSGKDLFVEKPLAFHYKEAEEIVRLAKKKKRVLMVDHLLHYHPAVIKLKELVAGGELGDIQYMYSNRLSIGKFRNKENILLSFAPHDISVILSLVGRMPVETSAFGEAYLQKGIYDTTLTTLVFDEKLKAHIFVNWLHPFKEQKLVVIGTKNMAVFNDQSAEKLLLYPHKVNWVDGLPVASKAPHEAIELAPEEPLGQACIHFIDCCKNRKTPLTDGEEALRVMRVLDEAQRVLERDQRWQKRDTFATQVQ